MFQFFKGNPEKKLQQAYERKLGEAMMAQRSGNMRDFAILQEEANSLYARLQALKQGSSDARQGRNPFC